MAAFPTYGLFLFEGYAEQPQSGLKRTEMESGPAKQAVVRSRVMVHRPIKYRFNATDYASFKTFVKDTLIGGSDWFDWSDPVDGVTKQARIVSGEYQGRAVSIGEGVLPEWEVSFSLETWE